MDDFLNDLGGSKPMSLVEEAWHTNQRRKAYDVIRVDNPTSVTVKGKRYEFAPEDFMVEYDTNQWQRIPGGTTTDIPHYIALRYVEHKKNDIINRVAKKLHDEQLAKRDEKGLPRYTNKYDENQETYETNDYPKTNDLELTNELYDQLWVGLVHEFGKDRPPVERDARSGEANISPVSQQALDRVSTKRVSPSDTPLGSVMASRPPIPTQMPQVEQPSGFADLNQRLTPEEISNE